MMMYRTFDIKEYWPQPKPGELIQHEYYNPADQKIIGNVFYTKPNDRYVYQEDYHGGEWKATWVMDYNHPNGVMELVDIYPAKKYQFWTKFRTTAFVAGKEIPWGKVQKVGDIIDQELQISAIKSTPFIWPEKGRQVVNFVAHYETFDVGTTVYKDVLEIAYDQTFGKMTAGARSFQAKGIGIVQMQWRGFGKDVGTPMPAVTKTGPGIVTEDKRIIWY
jgi:hypothetical protein